jgi:hypothetical protein
MNDGNLGYRGKDLVFFDMGASTNTELDVSVDRISMEEGEIDRLTERVLSWMPKAQSIKVKKSCQLGGKGDGTSDACDQGDMNNIELSPINDSNKNRRDDNVINVAEDNLEDRHYFKGAEELLKEDLMPDSLIDVFHERIMNKIKMGHKKDSPAIKQETDRILKVNGGAIPEKILNIITEELNENIVTLEELKAYNENMIQEANVMSIQNLPFRKEVEGMGGEIFAVGGAVRDEYIGKESKDLDIVIRGIPEEKLLPVLQKYGSVNAVGDSFAVWKFIAVGETDDVDIALPRTETPNGQGGHKGFDVQSDYRLPIVDDLIRRDLTINSIAKDMDGNIIDPHNGLEDIKNKIIRVVNPDSFSDDPLRMLRAVQFGARFGFAIDKNTMEMIKQNASTISTISSERILEEFAKIVNKGGDVRYGVQLLKDSGLYKEIFGVELDQSIITQSPFDRVKTLGELMFLMIQTFDEPDEYFIGRFMTPKARGSDMFKEIGSLKLGYTKTDNKPSANRMVANMMLNKFSEIANSDILPEPIKRSIDELSSGRYPIDVNHLQVDGRDLMNLGFQGQPVGDAQKALLKLVYRDELPNKKDDLLAYAKTIKQ